MKRIRNICFLALLCCIVMGCAAIPAFASDDDNNLTVANLPDAPAPIAQPADMPESPSYAPHHGGPSDNFASNREVSWRSVPTDFLHDQKAIWTSPAQLAKGRGWIPLGIVVGGTAGLIYADPHAMPYFQKHAQNIDKVNDVFDPMITTAEVIAVPVGLMAAGYIRHDSYQVGTAILCAEAYGNSAVIDLAIKAVTRRERPSDIPPGGSFENTFFNGGKSPFKGSSFPSGHSAGAFSVATVVADRYHRHRWVPWVVYGMATAISFSRVTSSAHFPSDVFLGAALGFTTTHYQVLRPR